MGAAAVVMILDVFAAVESCLCVFDKETFAALNRGCAHGANGNPCYVDLRQGTSIDTRCL